MFSIGAFAILLSALGGASLEGTVRSGDAGAPISAVRVEVVDQHRVSWTDSLGRYVLGDLPSGTHLLRISRLGYEVRTTEVVLAPTGILRVDIVLTPQPATLAEVRITDQYGATANPLGRDLVRDDRADDSWSRVDGRRLHGNPAFGAPDVLQALAILPEVGVLPDVATSLHVRGGSGDHNLILLDGVPLYNPFHAAGVLTALNPAVVSAVSISRDLASMRSGNALSSVIAVQTVPLRGDAQLAWNGRLRAGSVGQGLSGPLPRGAGAFAVSGDWSTRPLLANLANQGSSSASFGDVFAKVTVPTRYGDYEIFSLAGNDRLAFDARVDPAGMESEALTSADIRAGDPFTLQPQNSFAWRTSTQALVWRGPPSAAVSMSARAWQTRFHAGGDWAATAAPLTLESALGQSGLAFDVSSKLSLGVLTAGISTERIHTVYGLRSLGTPDSTAQPFPRMDASRAILSAFLEDRWSLGTRWALTVGARGAVGMPQTSVDPRIAVRFALAPRITLSTGYGRTRQYVQSMRNEESVLDAVVGVAFPVVGGVANVPVARADEFSLAADVDLATGTTLRVATYARRLDGLLLVAPATGQPFAVSQLSRGNGKASGLTAFFDWRYSGFWGQAGYAFASTSRAADGQQYRPAFSATHMLNTAVSYQLRADTHLRAAVWSSTGRQTSLVPGDFLWAPHNLLSGSGDMAGTPERIVGALDGERLSPYVRLDMGIQHRMRVGSGERATVVTGILNVSNVLNRRNALGRALLEDGRNRQDLPAAPRSLTLALEWSY